ncbi:sigma-54-dependent transcriptional regulator [Candidatus Nitrospira bockiana]
MADGDAVLVVDDDLQNRECLREALGQNGYRVEVADSGEEACRKASEQEFSVVVSDIQMGAVSGITMLKWYRENFPDTPVVLVTAFGTVETAIQAMKSGAFDYLSKPINLKELQVVIARAVEHYRLVRENRDLRKAFRERLRAGSIVAQSRSMIEIFKVVGKVAPTRASVLIYGESGTGKELIARAIHDNSPRADHPFVAINCSAVPDNLLESELFGHVKGAFTHADRLRRGLIEEASGGTLFLDEIADLSPAGQAKLLRVLQEGEIRRVGSNTNIKVDLRLLAASRRDLQQMVKDKRFREDLFYRLKTVSITVPPLRERPDDIPLLADLFLARYGSDRNMCGISAEAMDVLVRYDWPGNVRELEHVIECSVTLATHSMLSVEDLPDDVRHLNAPDVVKAGSEEPTPLATARRKAATMTREDVVTAYERARGNKAHMAQLLGISRWAVYRLLEKYGVQDQSPHGKTDL